MAELYAYKASDGRTIRVKADDEGNLIVAAATHVEFDQDDQFTMMNSKLDDLIGAVNRITDR